MYNSGDELGAEYKVARKIENKGGGLSFECFKVPHIMQIGQGAQLDNLTQQALENIPLNEPLSERGGKIDVLLGISVFWKTGQESKGPQAEGRSSTEYSGWCLLPGLEHGHLGAVAR